MPRLAENYRSTWRREHWGTPRFFRKTGNSTRWTAIIGLRSGTRLRQSIRGRVLRWLKQLLTTLERRERSSVGFIRMPTKFSWKSRVGIREKYGGSFLNV